MDDSDFDCLQKINDLQLKLEEELIDEDFFEKIIVNLEVLWFEMVKKKKKKKKKFLFFFVFKFNLIF